MDDDWVPEVEDDSEADLWGQLEQIGEDVVDRAQEEFVDRVQQGADAIFGDDDDEDFEEDFEDEGDDYVTVGPDSGSVFEVEAGGGAGPAPPRPSSRPSSRPSGGGGSTARPSGGGAGQWRPETSTTTGDTLEGDASLEEMATARQIDWGAVLQYLLWAGAGLLTVGAIGSFIPGFPILGPPSR